jgi:pimeloyl-ACP methyl ester carboxylesterase
MNTLYKNAENKAVAVKGRSFIYREIGPRGGTPLIMLHHLTAVLDDWDPAIIDELAKTHHVIAFDNAGVGGSEGKTPDSVAEMAKDAEAFIDALGLNKVDLFGFSLGGFVAQVIAQERPALVRKMILAGTSPTGGEGISKMGEVLQNALHRAQKEQKHPKHFLFFSPSEASQKAANEFLARLSERKDNLDKPVSNETIHAQVVAITKWGLMDSTPLTSITQPTLVVNGDEDVMAPITGSVSLFKKLPNAKLSIFPDSGHGGIFQYRQEFVQQARDFLEH